MQKTKKTEMIEFRCTPADREAIEKAAKRKDISVSELCRGSVLFCLLADLDAHAAKLLVGGLSDVLFEGINKLKVKRSEAA